MIPLLVIRCRFQNFSTNLYIQYYKSDSKSEDWQFLQSFRLCRSEEKQRSHCISYSKIWNKCLSVHKHFVFFRGEDHVFVKIALGKRTWFCINNRRMMHSVHSLFNHYCYVYYRVYGVFDFKLNFKKIYLYFHGK